jgi:hypothetical protein
MVNLLVSGKILLRVVFLDEEAGGGLERLGVRPFVYADFADRGEAPFLRSSIMIPHDLPEVRVDDIRLRRSASLHRDSINTHQVFEDMKLKRLVVTRVN